MEYSNLLIIISKIRNILYYYWFFIAHRSPNYCSPFSARMVVTSIREPLELFPSTGGARTPWSVHDDQYTADMFMENQQLRQNLEDADRVNAGLQEDLDNANRANAGLRVDLDHANWTNMQLHAAVEDMTSQLREQKGIARQKADDHSQLLEQFQALNVEFQDIMGRLGMVHNMVQDDEALRTENGRCWTVIKELWADM